MIYLSLRIGHARVLALKAISNVITSAIRRGLGPKIPRLECGIGTLSDILKAGASEFRGRGRHLHVLVPFTLSIAKQKNHQIISSYASHFKSDFEFGAVIRNTPRSFILLNE